MAVAVGLLFIGSCDFGTPVEPSQSTTTTTTTTVTSTTTTTMGPTTTTSTTTTTALVGYAAQVHPIWTNEGCTECHDASHVLNLNGTPTETCAAVAARDVSNVNLIITGAGRAESEIIRKPQPGVVSHFGGDFVCFDGVGKLCYDTVLAWLGQGAMGPTGACGG